MEVYRANADTCYLIGSQAPLQNKAQAIVGDLVRVEEGVVIEVARRSAQVIAGTLLLEDTKLYGKNKKGLKYRKVKPLSHNYPTFLVATKLGGRNRKCTIRFLSWENGQNFPRGELVGFPNIDKLYMIKNQLLSEPCGVQENLRELSKPEMAFDDVVVVDPPGSLDKDDGFSLGDGALYVHIADASWCSLIISEKSRLATLYGAERVYPMIPEEYSNGAMSLNSMSEPRRALTVCFEFPDMKFQWVRESSVRMKHIVTYEQSADLDEMKALCSAWKLDDPHDVVAKMMIHTNRAIAGLLSSNGLIMSRFQASELQPAVYSATDWGHVSLKLEMYTHFTSPIRRYYDYLVHKQVKNIMHGKPVENIDALQLARINVWSERAKRFHRDIKLEQLKESMPLQCLAKPLEYKYGARRYALLDHGIVVSIKETSEYGEDGHECLVELRCGKNGQVLLERL